MNASIESLRDTITPKSTQLNADDLIAGPIVVTITAVKRGDTQEQPISLAIDGGRMPYLPCKSMRRVMIAAWGDDGRTWVGKSMKLYCDPTVKFGGVKVGGIRISHMSGLASKLSVMLTTTRSKRSEFTVDPLVAERKPAAKPAPKPAPKPTEQTITGDPAEGDLSDIAPTIPAKPTEQRLDNVNAAFASIGKDAATEYGKPLEDWTEEDMIEAQVVFKALRASMAQEQTI